MVSTDVVSEVISAEASLAQAEDANLRATGEISNWRLTVYALPAIPIAFLYLPVAMLMPAYYAREMHVSLTAVGFFLVLSRLADVVYDPTIGRWSDMTRSRFGRRKIWMWIGTPILMLGSLLLFMPFVPVNGWYLLVASFVIYCGGSTVGLPYAAWGTELMETYHGRSRMAGFKEAAGVIGGVLAATIPAITGLFGHGVDRFTMGLMGCAIIILTPLSVAITTRYVKEPPVPRPVHVAWLPSIAALLKNKPFVIFCATYIIFTLGGSIPTATMVFYIDDYLGQSNIMGPALFLLAFLNVAAVPFWLWFSRKWGKHTATAVSLLSSMAIYGGATPFLHPGQGMIYVVLVALMGITSSGFITLPLGLIGDIIDYDTLKHGVRRGGIFWGVWSFAQKVAPALGIGVTLPLLKYLGYTPGTHNTHAALEALKNLYCFGPVPFYVVGGIVLLYFPINAKRHDVIRRRLMSREKRAAAAAAAAV